MATVSMKYFQDHVSDSLFDNQAVLAAVLDTFGKRCLIESNDISPLTVRLFNIKSGYDRILDCVTKLAILPFPEIFLTNGYYAGAGGQGILCETSASSGSKEYAHSYVTQVTDWVQKPCSYFLDGIDGFRIEFNNTNQVQIINENCKVHTFHLHSGLYDFFSNLDSAFDRIRLEVNSIYFDGKKELDSKKTKGNTYWADYLDTNNPVVKSLSISGFNSIATILTGPLAKSLDNNTGKYRNRLIHDGALELNINQSSGKVYIPVNPLAMTPMFGVELEPFVNEIYTKMQSLFHDIYAQIIIDLKTGNKVPLI